jgi:hypothetical protein
VGGTAGANGDGSHMAATPPGSSEVSPFIHEAYDLNLPLEPGVRTGETRSSAGRFFWLF